MNKKGERSLLLILLMNRMKVIYVAGVGGGGEQTEIELSNPVVGRILHYCFFVVNEKD